MSLARTFNINVRRIMSRRRGQYDLEDEFLWFNEYLQADSRWHRKPDGTRVTISDDPRYSTITLDCPHIELMNEKQNFVRICRGEPWMPQSVILYVKTDGQLSKTSRSNILLLENFPLLFLKKAGPGVGGGYDVTPIIPRKDELQEQVEVAITRQNENPRYVSEVFVLQEGVVNPLLTRLGQKMDLRLYMLIVGSPAKRPVFYACRVGDIRNTLRYPYDPLSVDTRLQVTNIAQNRKLAVSLSDITRIFSIESAPDWYGRIFRQFLHIVRRIKNLYEKLIFSEYERPYVTLIGLDAVVDADTMNPMIVELNRRPTVYTPEEAEEINYSSVLFMHDVYELGIQALANDTVGEIPSENNQFVLVE